MSRIVYDIRISLGSITRRSNGSAVPLLTFFKHSALCFKVKYKLVCRLIVLASYGGVELNSKLGTVLGEVEHSNNAKPLKRIINTLCVYQELCNRVTVYTLELIIGYVIIVEVTANDHLDIGVLAYKFTPHIVTIVVFGILSRGATVVAVIKG